MNIPHLISRFGLSTLFIQNTTDTTIYLSNYSLLFTVNKLNKYSGELKLCISVQRIIARIRSFVLFNCHFFFH